MSYVETYVSFFFTDRSTRSPTGVEFTNEYFFRDFNLRKLRRFTSSWFRFMETNSNVFDETNRFFFFVCAACAHSTTTCFRGHRRETVEIRQNQ